MTDQLTRSAGDMVLWIKRPLTVPVREGSIRFAIQYRDGQTSNAWGVHVEKAGDAYVYCRDHMKGQKVSLHASGKQHITVPTKPASVDGMSNRFLNQWYEPAFGKQAVATFQILFPSWGNKLNHEQRESQRARWKKNDILIEADDESLIVVSFIIMNEDHVLRKAEGPWPSTVVGILPLREGKKLWVLASKGLEGDLKENITASFKHIDARRFVPEDLYGETISLSLTGFAGDNPNSVWMVVVPAVYSPDVVHSPDGTAEKAP